VFQPLNRPGKRDYGDGRRSCKARIDRRRDLIQNAEITKNSDVYRFLLPENRFT
jgi:hypothetical protein